MYFFGEAGIGLAVIGAGGLVGGEVERRMNGLMRFGCAGSGGGIVSGAREVVSRAPSEAEVGRDGGATASGSRRGAGECAVNGGEADRIDFCEADIVGQLCSTVFGSEV